WGARLVPGVTPAGKFVTAVGIVTGGITAPARRAPAVPACGVRHEPTCGRPKYRASPANRAPPRKQCPGAQGAAVDGMTRPGRLRSRHPGGGFPPKDERMNALVVLLMTSVPAADPLPTTSVAPAPFPSYSYTQNSWSGQSDDNRPRFFGR